MIPPIFFEVLLAFAPSVVHRSLECRQAVGRQLHYKWCFVFFEEEASKESCSNNGYYNAAEIQSGHDQPSVSGEECAAH